MPSGHRAWMSTLQHALGAPHGGFSAVTGSRVLRRRLNSRARDELRRSRHASFIEAVSVPRYARRSNALFLLGQRVRAEGGVRRAGAAKCDTSRLLRMLTSEARAS